MAGRREVILGIDFGTTYTAAGAIVDGRVELIRDEGDVEVPSIVHFPQVGAPVAGKRAALQLPVAPGSTVRSIKRILGRAANDTEVRLHDMSSGYRLVSNDKGRVNLKIRSTEVTCEQVVAALLRKMKDLARLRFGGDVRRAVITCPANADEAFEKALKRAARLAHLEVLAMLPEPVAGALAMGLHGQAAQRNILLCDFGGGTFDVSVVAQDGLHFSVLSQGGDSFLGGDDLDESMCAAIAGVVERQSGFNMLNDIVRKQHLLSRCESVKRILSTRSESGLAMRDAYIEDSARKTLECIVERKWIEPRWAPILDRSAQAVDHTLAESGLDYSDITTVVLVGGSSLVPAFRRRIVERVGSQRLMTDANANLAVAIGATLHTAAFLPSMPSIPVLKRAAAPVHDCTRAAT